MRLDRNWLGATAAGLLALGTPAVAGAQTPFQLDRGSATAAWAQVQRPSFKGSGISAWLVDAGARIRISSQAYLLADVPLVTTSVSGGLSGEDGFMVGNPFLGIEFLSGGVRAELGLRPSLVSDNAPFNSVLVGAIANIERLEAYAPAWSFSADVSYALADASGLRFEVGGGPMLALPKGGGKNPIYANYRAGFGLEVSQVRFMSYLSGRWYVNDSGANFGEATVHQLTLAGTYVVQRVRPTLFVRVPLDKDLSDVLSTMVGLGVTIGL